MNGTNQTQGTTEIKAPPKIRILAYTSSPTAPTGFGVFAKEIFTRLYQAGQLHQDNVFPKYQIQIIGVDFRPGDQNTFPFHICTTRDEWGILKLDEVIKREKFDIFFIMQDLHVFGLSGRDPRHDKPNVVDLMNQVQPDVPIITYFPVDRTPVPTRYIDQCLRKCDLNFAKSEFGKKEIEKTVEYYGGDPIKVDVIKSGVNTKEFFCIPSDDRKAIKKKWGWQDRFIIINVNRFQPRKNIQATLRAAALFGEGYKICDNCNNYYPKWKDCCDLCYSENVKEIKDGAPEMLLFLHMNNNEPSMGETKLDWLNHHVMCSGFSDQSGHMVYISNEFGKNKLGPEQVNLMYNMADVYLSTSLGEGVGLTTLEAMATGTKVIVPAHTSLIEYVGKAGHLIPCVAHVALPRDMAAQRQIVSVPKIVDALHEEYKEWLDNDHSKNIDVGAMKHIEQFSWDECAKKIDGAIMSVLGNRKLYRGIKNF